MADQDIPSVDRPPVLVLETSIVNSAVVQGSGTPVTLTPGLLIAASNTAAIEEMPCGKQIEPLLYALDVFVPALEIHQGSRCGITVESRGYWWRIARAVYAILGWIVTALTVLTVSGVTRRHLEG